MKKNPFAYWSAVISRFLLAITFVFSGFVKAIDPLGTVYKIEDYLKAFGGFFDMLMPLAEPAAICLICFEFLLGIALLFGVRNNLTGWFALLMMLVMTPLTLYLAIKNPVSDCGCFGDAIILTNWQTFGKNVVLLVLVIVFLCTKKYLHNFLKPLAEWIITLFALFFVCGWMTWTRLNLPLWDFRPYKVGNNIPELMSYPDDAEPDVYETTLIYSKNGVEHRFTLQDYPKNDSTWTFVEQQSVLVKKGYEPPIHDFELIDEDFNDLTDELLEEEQIVVFAVMYDLEKTKKQDLVRLQDLYEQCLRSGKRFYALTGSGQTVVEDIRTEIGTTYPFCFVDPVTLKTIVRANPGIVEIKEGTIINKWNFRKNQIK
ncbi:MAG: DoxX family protein [Paludibacteraceae bacterium]|nr:DoxX family protein [Paludibacteraceae bacterium]